MITSRQKEILKLIVEEFTRTCEPVGSKSICDKLNCSSATVRNEMVILEENGFIEKTHTSSGRVPSSSGYRFYIEEILEKDKHSLVPNTIKEIDKLFEDASLEREEAIRQAINLLSDMTNCTSIALGPDASKQKIKKVELIHLTDRKSLLIVVTDRGYVENKEITLDANINKDELKKVIDILNDLLYDTYLSEVSEKLTEALNEQNIKEFMDYRDLIVDNFINAFMKFAKDRYYVGGKTNLLAQPEFMYDMIRVKNVLEALENEEIFKVIQSDSTGLSVRIGQETKITGVDDLAVITVPYDTDTEDKGSISLVGPSRMEYRKVIPLLEYIAKNISKLYKK